MPVVHHPVVLVVTVVVVATVACMPSEAVAGEEDDRDDEHDAGDDGDPRRAQKDPGGSADGLFYYRTPVRLRLSAARLGFQMFHS